MKDNRPKSVYRRISSTNLAMIMRCSLWICSDHLLLVKSTGYTEDYTRIYLKDLKGVVAHRTKTWMLTNAIAGSVLLLSFISILSTDDLFSFGTIFLGIVTTPMFMVFLYHLYLGPTCRTEILTPLGPLDIPAVRRTRNLERLLKELRPAVAEVQSSIPRSRLLSEYDAAAGSPSVAPAGQQ